MSLVHQSSKQSIDTNSKNIQHSYSNHPPLKSRKSLSTYNLVNNTNNLNNNAYDKNKILHLFKDLISVVNQSIPLLGDNQFQRQKKITKNFNAIPSNNINTNLSAINNIPLIHQVISMSQRQKVAGLLSPKLKKERSSKISKKIKYKERQKQREEVSSQQLINIKPSTPLADLPSKKLSFHELPESSQHHNVVNFNPNFNFNMHISNNNINQNNHSHHKIVPDLADRLKQQIFWNYQMIMQYQFDQFSQCQDKNQNQSSINIGSMDDDFMGGYLDHHENHQINSSYLGSDLFQTPKKSDKNCEVLSEQNQQLLMDIELDENVKKCEMQIDEKQQKKDNILKQQDNQKEIVCEQQIKQKMIDQKQQKKQQACQEIHQLKKKSSLQQGQIN